jgi:hypothetical protein
MAHAVRAHLITGGFPPGSSAGHDQDYPRLRLLTLLAEQEIATSVANDFADVERWLPTSRLLITYVAGPYPDAAQTRAMRTWLEAGGHWLALHGTSGGRAERVESVRQRRTVKTEHHALLGSFFLTHPPIRRFRVDVRDSAHPITRGLGASFEVEDEPYFIELQDPASTRILLSAEYGPDVAWPLVETLYGSDTSLQADRRTRVLGWPWRSHLLRARPCSQSRLARRPPRGSVGDPHVSRILGDRCIPHAAPQRNRVEHDSVPDFRNGGRQCLMRTKVLNRNFAALSSFRRRPESRADSFWTPAFAGVT